MDDVERKLGLKPDTNAFVVHAPAGYSVGAQSVKSCRDIPDNAEWIQAFYIDETTLLNELGLLALKLSKSGQLWLSWPKKASGQKTDLSDYAVRDAGLRAGLVDVKVASISNVWSGIKFVYRLVDRS